MLLLSTSLPSRVMGPVLEFLVQQRYVHNKANPVKGHGDDRGLKHLMYEWILKDLRPSEEKSLGDLIK